MTPHDKTRTFSDSMLKLLLKECWKISQQTTLRPLSNEMRELFESALELGEFTVSGQFSRAEQAVNSEILRRIRTDNSSFGA